MRKQTMRLFTWLCLCSFIPSALYAQTAPQMFTTDGKDPIPISEVKVEAVINGYLSKTSVTLTFTNPHDRVLEGNFVFPLPAECSLSGYALDINDQMVDGVIVEKDRGRTVFESIVRERVDPGLVEWTQGNTFKTRVFPIPRKGTRKIRVDYESPLICNATKATYCLPVSFAPPGAKGEVHIDILGHRMPPATNVKPLVQLGFRRTKSGWSSQARLSEYSPREDIQLQFTHDAKAQVVVEKNAHGDDYFFIQDQLDLPSEESPPLAGAVDIGLVWDASASCAHANHQAAIELLTAWINDQPQAQFTIHLMELRERIRYVASISAQADAMGELIRHLKAIHYDGASSFEAVHRIKWPSPPERVLLFSDGRPTFGPPVKQISTIPIYTFNISRASNLSLLRMLAESSKGRFFDLHQTSAREACQALRTTPALLLAIQGPVTEYYPPIGSEISQQLSLTGRIIHRKHPFDITVSYGYGRGKTKQKTIRIDPEQTLRTAVPNLISRNWAQQKINRLLIYENENFDQISALGNAYKIVTPGTSFLVLDTPEQYIRHHIRPPDTMPDWQMAYDKSATPPVAINTHPPSELSPQLRLAWQDKTAWWHDTNQVPDAFASRDRVTQGWDSFRWQESVNFRHVTPSSHVRMGNRLPPDASITNRLQCSLQQWTLQDLLLINISFTNALQIIQHATKESPLGELPFHVSDTANGQYGNTLISLTTNRCSLLKVLETMAATASMRLTVSDRIRFLPLKNPQPLITQTFTVDPILYAESNFGLWHDTFGAGGGGGFGEPLDSATSTQAQDTAAALNGMDSTPAPRILLVNPPPESFIQILSNTDPAHRYQVYHTLKGPHVNHPDFFIQCSTFFVNENQPDLALSILSNLAELQVDDPTLLRVLAQQLMLQGEWASALPVCQRILRLRQEEPQSHRDLALLHAQMNQVDEAVTLMRKVVYNDWGRFDAIKEVALLELNELLQRSGHSPALDASKIHQLPDCDIRIVLSWNTDATNLDLQVTEPGGEICESRNTYTRSGGRLSRDIRDGYGPEEYLIRNAPSGTYQIAATFKDERTFALHQTTHVLVDIFTNYGRPNQVHRRASARVQEVGESTVLAQISL